MKGVNQAIKKLRTEFNSVTLDKSKIEKNPYTQFEVWFQNAIDAGANEPSAMTLATADSKGNPDARVVLLKSADKNGFTFFTNYGSRKGNELTTNRKVCLNFYWPELSRQVRIRGTAVKVARVLSDEYFQSRPRESQISAWASNQSNTIPGRGDLEKRYIAFEKKFQNKKVPCPSHWGGYLVKPVSIEFWQGRNNRLHDRILFERNRQGKWKISRLAP